MFGVILLQIVLIVGFIVVLYIGERSRWTLIALYLPRQPLIISTVGCGILVPVTRMKRWIRPLVAAQVVLSLVVLFPVMGFSVGLAGSPSTPDKVFRLASYNIHYGHEGRERVLDEIVAIADRADIIVLQASFGSLTEKIAPRLPDRRIHQENEFVLISRFPIQKAEVGPHLDTGDDTPSMYVKYVIDTPGGALRVFNVHPYSPRYALFYDDGTPKNIDHREEQILASVTAARSDPPPFILLGDTNLPPMSAVARRNFAGLRDAFEDSGFGFGYTFPVKYPWMRIDRAFGSGVKFLDARVGPRGASDHRAIFVDAEIVPEH